MPKRYRDGTTHIVLEPLDIMARLAALVPPPRMHLTRYHGVFARHSKLRAAATPAHRGMGTPKQPAAPATAPAKPTPRHVAMSWARRLKRVFGSEIERCARCSGSGPGGACWLPGLPGRPVGGRFDLTIRPAPRIGWAEQVA